MDLTDTYVVLAIPLNRPEITQFLLPPPGGTPGVSLQVIRQRPGPAAQASWLARLQAARSRSLSDLLAIDDPHYHVVETTTGRLVPVQFLEQPDFLTRNLGGWAPVYFGVVGLPQPRPDDPLLTQAEILHTYGRRIHYFGADEQQVAGRVALETGLSVADLVAAVLRLHSLRPAGSSLANRYRFVERLHEEAMSGNCLATGREPPLPRLLLLDELMDQLVTIELARRAARADEDEATAKSIGHWQASFSQALGSRLILKGEYIVGRHRRSTVLILPELGVVVKQPAPEPFHEIELGAKSVAGQAENWPYLTHDGALVTPRGRLRLILEEGILDRLTRLFAYETQFSSLLGLTIEPFITGRTVQEIVLADFARLTPDLYDFFVLHQQACELLGIENGDWHAANFMERREDGRIFHVDWGAARPLHPEELTPAGRLARLNQVKNIAFSFHNDEVARRVEQLHADLLADEARLDGIRRRAQAMIAAAGLKSR